MLTLSLEQVEYVRDCLHRGRSRASRSVPPTY